jgi:hypothetical protein
MVAVAAVVPVLLVPMELLLLVVLVVQDFKFSSQEHQG